MSGEEAAPAIDKRQQAVDEYKAKLLQHKEIDSKVRSLREDVKKAKVEYDKTEDDLKALQSVGQIIGEVLRQLDEERCTFLPRDHSKIHLSHSLFSSQSPSFHSQSSSNQAVAPDMW